MRFNRVVAWFQLSALALRALRLCGERFCPNYRPPRRRARGSCAEKHREIRPIPSIVLGCGGEGVGGSNLVDRGAQNIFINAAGGSDATSSLVGRFLDHVAVMSARPFPLHFMPRRRLVQACPPFVICL